jgi:uncharacterized protein with FMN-binding domain
VRRIVIWLASTVTIVVLLFGYHTSTNSAAPAAASTGAGTATTEPSTTPSSSASGSASSSASSKSRSSGSSSSSSSTPSASSSGTKSYSGDVAQTRWGPVEVKITVTAGKITKVDVLQYPSGNPKDQEINDYALPILVQDTLSAQSAKIDMISGATVTSDGYVQSLQSALDAAGI